MSPVARIRPVFPNMPTEGLLRTTRQPIYVALALTLRTVPVWTLDQFALATAFTVCCMVPVLKECRFAARYGNRVDRYAMAVNL